MLKRWREGLVERWDWMIYRLARHSIDRMCERNGGFAYLFELSLRDWRKKHPISPELERATETFYDSLRNHTPKGGESSAQCKRMS